MPPFPAFGMPKAANVVEKQRPTTGSKSKNRLHILESVQQLPRISWRYKKRALFVLTL